MSILIKGIKMPTSCAECLNVGLWNVFECHLDDVEQGKRPDCPLIEIPDKHGRLIDVDALEQDAQKRLLVCNKYDDQFQKPYEVMRAIALAPTIIENEE